MAIQKKLDISESVTPYTEAPYISKTKKEQAKDMIKALIVDESRLVKGVFQCFETPGASVKISYQKYPGIPMFDRVMTDGETYEIPLYVARHLNGIDISAGALGDPATRNPNIGSCSYPVHGYKMQNPAQLPGMMDIGVSVPIVGIAKRVKRYGFLNTEFGI